MQGEPSGQKKPQDETVAPRSCILHSAVSASRTKRVQLVYLLTCGGLASLQVDTKSCKCVSEAGTRPSQQEPSDCALKS
eukprot:3258636-Amphidinium_carterae.1